MRMRYSIKTRVTAMILTAVLALSLITCGSAPTQVLAAQTDAGSGTAEGVLQDAGEIVRYMEEGSSIELENAEQSSEENLTAEEGKEDSTEESKEDPTEEPELEKIIFEKGKTNYYTGDEISWDDVTVTAVYTDGTTVENIPRAVKDDEDGYVLSNYEIDSSAAGTYEVTVEYGGKTATITITVVQPIVLTEIKAVKDQTEYCIKDDLFSWNDLKVTAYYSNNSSRELSAGEYTMDPQTIDLSTEGEREVKISYTENGITAETSITITVVRGALSKITAKKTKKTYTVNDKLDVDDLKVTAYYNNDKNSRVLSPEEYTTNADSLKLAPSGKYNLVITYTEGGITKEVTIKITVNVPDVPVINGVRTANVLDFGADPTDIYTDKAAIQDALDVAASEEVPLVVYIPAGTYYIGGPLYIHSNTTIRMADGAKIIRNSTIVAGDGRDGINHNMLKAANSGKTTNTVGKYDNVKNIVIEGGIWDGGEIAKATTDSNLINLGHAENVVIRNTTIQNCYGNHLIEFAGVKNAEVYNCYFTGFRKMTNGVESEAIQLDICYSDWNPAYKADKTVCSDISIHDNTFVDYPVSVGNHHALNGYHNKNITIAKNTITHTKKTGYQGIYLYGCDNSTVKNNTISGFENGIKTNASSNYTLTSNTISNCNFGVVSAGSSTGKITSNTISNTVYQGIFAYDSTKITSISKNKLKKVGTKAGTPRDGIAVCGAGSSVDSITQNTIDTSKRHGIYVYSGAKVPKISKNTISNTKKCGICVENSKSKVTFKSNKLNNVGSTAIKIQNTTYVKQKYTFAPKIKSLNLAKGTLTITADNLKKVQLKFKNKSYSKSTKKKSYTLKFKKYKKSVSSADVLFTDKYKNVITKTKKIN